MAFVEKYEVKFSVGNVQAEQIILRSNFGLALSLSQTFSNAYASLLSPCCTAELIIQHDRRRLTEGRLQVTSALCRRCSASYKFTAAEQVQSGFLPAAAFTLPGNFDLWLTAAVERYLEPLSAQLVAQDMAVRILAMQDAAVEFMLDYNSMTELDRWQLSDLHGAIYRHGGPVGAGEAL